MPQWILPKKFTISNCSNAIPNSRLVVLNSKPGTFRRPSHHVFRDHICKEHILSSKVRDSFPTWSFGTVIVPRSLDKIPLSETWEPHRWQVGTWREQDGLLVSQYCCCILIHKLQRGQYFFYRLLLFKLCFIWIDVVHLSSHNRNLARLASTGATQYSKC